MEYSLLAEATNAATATKAPKPSNSFLIYSLILTILLIVNIYFMIKFFINYKRNIDKTKKTLNEYLVKKYMQGMNLKSNGFFNMLFIGSLILAQIIISSISLARVYSDLKISNINEKYLGAFYLTLVTGILLLVSLIFGQIIIFYVKFNYPQYKQKSKDIEAELVSLKEFKNEELNVNYPKEIKIDFDKLKSDNVLLSNILSRWMQFYNKMNEQEIITKKNKEENLLKPVYSSKKQYDLFLNQLFKINYFKETFEEINKKEELRAKMLEEIETKKTKEENSQEEKIQNEVAWMKEMDDKSKLLKEEKETPAMTKEEFKKNYDEYVAMSRSMDPIYQSSQKNSWLFYRDAEIEDLFYNVTTTIHYSYDNEEVVNEKELSLFLEEYKNHLISKFLLTR
ncbi:Hypothetical protein, predicted transmembrane protein [Metamycoplasma auris 15026]|uniref:Uncharacterized protein n=1 Tax=Metamycoplasma auris 15026 TaxID=1188233 RepID=N9V0E9_9BACT|nr:hypothetical protein [Metamycoplasma auris]ENY68897.1 Hypothetical protein, predicted transmembrane protein [Metamycoplasma auris 15026]